MRSRSGLRSQAKARAASPRRVSGPEWGQHTASRRRLLRHFRRRGKPRADAGACFRNWFRLEYGSERDRPWSRRDAAVAAAAVARDGDQVFVVAVGDGLFAALCCGAARTRKIELSRFVVVTA